MITSKKSGQTFSTGKLSRLTRAGRAAALFERGGRRRLLGPFDRVGCPGWRSRTSPRGGQWLCGDEKERSLEKRP